MREELACIPRGTFGARPVSLISTQGSRASRFPLATFSARLRRGQVRCRGRLRAIVSQSPAIVHGFVMR
ncbi:MAG TPA: hypothetical protein VN956_16880, partial [Pyrinomonadaceae bacterium]|nr:hypothetical protein [Pyrinomonadaceae bacterium]